MPRAALRTPLVREVSIYPGVDLALQLDIKLVQQFFLVREVGEECARSNARAPGDLRRRRAEPDVGNLVHRRLRQTPRKSYKTCQTVLGIFRENCPERYLAW